MKHVSCAKLLVGQRWPDGDRCDRDIKHAPFADCPGHREPETNAGAKSKAISIDLPVAIAAVLEKHEVGFTDPEAMTAMCSVIAAMLRQGNYPFGTRAAEMTIRAFYEAMK